MTHTETKKCELCGSEFERPKWADSMKIWGKIRLCSDKCRRESRIAKNTIYKRASCVTCGRPVPKHGMIYCGRECRKRPHKECPYCKKPHRNKRPYCSRDCSIKDRLIKPEIRTCKHCGAEFDYKPNKWTRGDFCSCKCSGLFNVSNGVCDLRSPETRKATLAGIRASPIAGPYETNCHAEYWFLTDPIMGNHKVLNLAHFIRSNADLFTERELEYRKVGGTLAYGGLAGLKPRTTRTKINSTWHGWRWWLEGEIAHQEATNK